MDWFYFSLQNRRVSSPALRQQNTFQVFHRTSLLPFTHELKVIIGECSQLHPTLRISKFQFRSVFLFLLHPGSFPAWLLLPHQGEQLQTQCICHELGVQITISCSVRVVPAPLAVCSLKSPRDIPLICQPGSVFP